MREPTPILAAELDRAGTKLITQRVELIRDNQAWEVGITEGVCARLQCGRKVNSPAHTVCICSSLSCVPQEDVLAVLLWRCLRQAFLRK